MNRSAAGTRGNFGMKLGRFVSEAMVPLLVLMVALPAAGFPIGSAQSYAVGFGYALVASALKVYLMDVTRARFEANNALTEFYAASSVFYGLLALGMLKAFELVTS